MVELYFNNTNEYFSGFYTKYSKTFGANVIIFSHSLRMYIFLMKVPGYKNTHPEFEKNLELELETIEEIIFPLRRMSTKKNENDFLA